MCRLRRAFQASEANCGSRSPETHVAEEMRAARGVKCLKNATRRAVESRASLGEPASVALLTIPSVARVRDPAFHPRLGASAPSESTSPHRAMPNPARVTAKNGLVRTKGPFQGWILTGICASCIARRGGASSEGKM